MALTIILLSAILMLIILAIAVVGVTQRAAYALGRNVVGRNREIVDELRDIYRATVVVTIIVVVAIVLSIVIYWGTPPPTL